MESLHHYIIYESEIQDLTDYIVNLFGDIVGNSKDLISVIKAARTERKDAIKDRNARNVERILLDILDDEEFYRAVTNGANEYDIRRILKRKVSHDDAKYIPDIINYINTVKSKNNLE